MGGSGLLLLLLLLLLCVCSCCGSTNQQLRFFSVWDASLNGSEPNTVDGNIAVQRGWLNFLFTSANATIIRETHGQTPVATHCVCI
jgi:hypothetical protein